MRTYSPFFQTLYDEQAPVGHLGRGTHYSVLRAVVFHDEDGKPIKTTRYRNAEARFHDFAIIWDEDHDTRIIEVIEKIYTDGLLPCCTFLGERKGGLTALSKTAPISQATELRIQDLCDDISNDHWPADFGMISQPQGIISDKAQHVVHYLQNIDMLWQLGSKPVTYSSPPQD